MLDDKAVHESVSRCRDIFFLVVETPGRLQQSIGPFRKPMQKNGCRWTKALNVNHKETFRTKKDHGFCVNLEEDLHWYEHMSR